MNMLSLEGVLAHDDSVTVETELEVFSDLLSTFWKESHPLVTDLLSLVRHNAQ